MLIKRSSSAHVRQYLSASRFGAGYSTYTGVWAGGWGGGRGAAALSPKFGQLRFFTQHEKFGQSQLLEKFECVCACCYFFCEKRYLLF